jgi:branched-chain amino acid transport system substrate-binding protein
MAVSLTGRYALLGRQVAAGARCYVDDVNAVGGISVSAGVRARPVELIVADDESSVVQCERRVRDLIEEAQVDLLLGPYSSGLTMAAARIAESAGTVLWNHSGSADEIFRAGFQYLVGIISPASSYYSGILALVRQRDPNARRVAIVSADTGFAEDVANGAARLVAEHGLTLSSHQRYATGSTDFTEILQRLRGESPDCLLGVGRVEDDLEFASALCVASPPIKSIGLVVAAIDQFRIELGSNADGFIAPSQWEPSVSFPVDTGVSAKNFARSYAQQSDEPIDYPAVQAYAGALIAQQCVELAGTLEQAALREAANELQCNTLYGRFRIEPDTGRQIAHEMLVTQWIGGQKIVVWPPQAATAAFIYPHRFAT